MKTIALVIENSREYGRNMIRGIAAFGQLRRDWRLRLVTPAELVVTGALDGYSGVIARVVDARILQCLKAANLPVVDVFAHFTQTDFIRVGYDTGAVGRFGVYNFDVSSLTDRRSDVHRHFLYHTEYGPFWDYDWKIADDWTLHNGLMAVITLYR